MNRVALFSFSLVTLSTTALAESAPVPAVPPPASPAPSTPLAATTALTPLAPLPAPPTPAPPVPSGEGTTVATAPSSLPPAVPPAPPPVPPCAEPPGSHVHDGFYFRLAEGYGYTTITGNGAFGQTSVSGGGSATSLLFGGTPVRGFVVGGGLHVTTATGSLNGGPLSSSTVSGEELTLGPFVDWYPDARDGWHVGLLAGLGGARRSERVGRSRQRGVPLLLPARSSVDTTRGSDRSGRLASSPPRPRRQVAR